MVLKMKNKKENGQDRTESADRALRGDGRESEGPTSTTSSRRNQGRKETPRQMPDGYQSSERNKENRASTSEIEDIEDLAKNREKKRREPDEELERIWNNRQVQQVPSTSTDTSGPVFVDVKMNNQFRIPRLERNNLLMDRFTGLEGGVPPGEWLEQALTWLDEMGNATIEQKMTALIPFLFGTPKDWFMVARTEKQLTSVAIFEELFRIRFMNNPIRAKTALHQIQQNPTETLLELGDRIKTTAFNFGYTKKKGGTDPRIVAFIRALRSETLRTQLFRDTVYQDFDDVIVSAQLYDQALDTMAKAAKHGRNHRNPDPRRVRFSTAKDDLPIQWDYPQPPKYPTRIDEDGRRRIINTCSCIKCKRIRELGGNNYNPIEPNGGNLDSIGNEIPRWNHWTNQPNRRRKLGMRPRYNGYPTFGSLTKHPTHCPRW
eukprot:GHVU01199866.1.p1 GENE.GHVU01199866.1~~GHVU01199866.1.p1  ORF type:complete len:432 (-),score=50.63 GHVU01199866.1:29-1324(-)